MRTLVLAIMTLFAGIALSHCTPQTGTGTASSSSVMANPETNSGSTVGHNGKEGDFCGGIAAFPCDEGLVCKYDGTYPDAGGTCVPQ